MSLAVGW